MQTDLSPLPYDAAAAHEARSALQAARRSLLQAMDARQGLLQVALQQWRGGHRHRFASSDTDWWRSARLTLDALSLAERRVAGELQDIREVNRRRAMAQRLAS